MYQYQNIQTEMGGRWVKSNLSIQEISSTSKRLEIFQINKIGH